MKVCPYCGRNNDDNEPVCRYCYAGFTHETDKNDHPVEEEKTSEQVSKKRTRR